MSADRDAHGARQALLLGSLLRGEGFPEGFDPRLTAAASAALRRRRARMVAKAWPALEQALGEDFQALFERHANGAAPIGGGARGDGARFVRGLPAGVVLTDAARVELLVHRARLARGPFAIVATRLRETPRVLACVRLPFAGTRLLAIGPPRSPACASTRGRNPEPTRPLTPAEWCMVGWRPHGTSGSSPVPHKGDTKSTTTGDRQSERPR